LLSNLLKGYVRRSVLPFAATLARLGVTPNALTIAGLILNLGVGLVLGLGYEMAGGILVLVAGLFDTLDGAVARVSGRVTVFGSFLDSTLDRYSEAAVFCGLLVLYTRQGRLTEAVLVYAVIIGSLLVSYARARAEGLGLDCEVGWLQRPERIALLGLGLAVGLATPVLWVLAILTNFTVLQRMLHVYRLTQAQRESTGNGS
jgi:CDP-diacylglycerol---glycerol-3-phosphate 3-phosphatidyltransferase